MKINKKGVSPVIATILLIALVVIIGMVIFNWFKSMQQEAITKFDGQNIKIVCDDVQFNADYNGGELSLSNFGNVPIYDLNLKINYPGGHETKSISDTGFDWPENGLNQGGVASSQININPDTTSIILIPVLLGVDKDGNKKSAPCEERQGNEVPII